MEIASTTADCLLPFLAGVPGIPFVRICASDAQEVELLHGLALIETLNGAAVSVNHDAKALAQWT